MHTHSTSGPSAQCSHGLAGLSVTGPGVLAARRAEAKPLFRGAPRVCSQTAVPAQTQANPSTSAPAASPAPQSTCSFHAYPAPVQTPQDTQMHSQLWFLAGFQAPGDRRVLPWKER